MAKSYSPISLPQQQGHVELLVKAYPPRPPGHPPVHGPPGGLARHLNGLKVGETVEMELKAAREIHGEGVSRNRWRELGLVAAGTGLAPLLQVARTLLADADERTRISLVFANRNVGDILMKTELDALASAHPERFRVHYVLSSPPTDGSWQGGVGRVSKKDLEKHLPPPSDDIMVMVCGRDEFVASVGGPTVRAAPPPGKKKGPKVQGPLTGLLAELGYSASCVYKF